MTIKDFLAQSQSKLSAANIPTARLDSLILLEDISGKDRSWLLAHPEHELSGAQVKQLESLLKRRARHEPLAYIRGKSAFYGRDFLVTSDTLQPRPETETLVEIALQIVNSKKIIDVGTGSGAIAITLKLENPELDVLATDISEPCLVIARKNAQKLKADVVFTQTNLVSGFNKDTLSNSVLCCNLPYVPANFTINQAAMFEPEIAIFGGTDGLDYYRQLFDQLRVKNARPAAILAESLPTQHKELESIAAEHKFKLEKTEDFIQLFLSQ